MQSHAERDKRLKERLAQSQSLKHDPIVHHTFAERLQLPKYFEENKITVYKKDAPGRKKEKQEKQEKQDGKQAPGSPAPNHYNLSQDWSSKSGVFKSTSKQSVSVYH